MRGRLGLSQQRSKQTTMRESLEMVGGRILNMWSLDNVTCSYLENGISGPSLSGCKNPLPLSLNSDPLFVRICTQSLQSLVVAQRCPQLIYNIWVRLKDVLFLVIPSLSVIIDSERLPMGQHRRNILKGPTNLNRHSMFHVESGPIPVIRYKQDYNSTSKGL